ncbi:MAG TPA: DUF5313 family protein [Pseudonocardiaceae bacterium]
MSSVHMRRPNPVRWLWYVYGGSLPDRHRDWVRHDLAGPHWVPRHVVRVLVQIAPVAAVAVVLLRLFTPVSWWAIAGVLVMGLLLCLWFAIGLARDFCTSRLRRHGFSADVQPPKSAWILSDSPATVRRPRR